MQTSILQANSIVRRLIGHQCWHVSYVEELSQAIGLSFGGKKPRKRPLLRASSDSDFGRWEGEFTLTLWCSWRVRRPPDSIVVSSSESTPDRVHQQLSVLIGASVSDARIGDTHWDLQLTFASGVVLEAFCSLDETTDPTMQCDISMRYDNRRLALGPGGSFSDREWAF
jgi:hypothetical protein